VAVDSESKILTRVYDSALEDLYSLVLAMLFGQSAFGFWLFAVIPYIYLFLYSLSSAVASHV